jgi:alpha-2-macroglobulin
LKNYQMKEAIKIRNYINKKKKAPKKSHADNMDAFVFMVLIDADSQNEEMAGYLYEGRNHLAVYGKSMIALSFHKLKQMDKVKMLRRNIEQFLKIDDENQTAYLELGNSSYWWNWYGSEWEAHAYYLKLLAKVDPKGEVAPKLVKYLVNNRRHGTYWNSTRDTALCIEAMADYMRATDEMSPDMTVELLVDGEKVKEVKINRENLFTFDNKLILDSAKLGSGKHKVEVRRKGKGPLYFNAYMTYFSKEDYIKKAGLEVKVQRKFYKLVRKEDKNLRPGKNGQVIKANQEAYQRIPLKDLDTLKSGDLVEVELEIQSKNDYEYIVFEDLKAAGFEAVDVRSGYRRAGGMNAYQEMKNDRVAFFITSLPRGTHNISYRLRAEISGKFSALPAKVYGNYAPELQGNSDEIKIQIED